MSQAPHCIHLRNGVKMGDAELVDTMIRDGLWDAFNGYHMGNTAENVAQRWQITRDQQDAFAAASQAKAEAAQKAGRFKDEIVPVKIATRRGETVVDTDEHPKHGTTVEVLSKLRPAFDKNGTVTAGNASGINDGAAAVVLMTAAEAEKRGVKPLARIVSWATAGVDPAIMGSGPIPASRMALKKAGWSADSLDLIEANEAFAAQACAVNKDLGWDVQRVNVNGGAIALGHPIGASGARVLVTLLHEMQRRNVQQGPRHLVHRRRDGDRDVRRARLESNLKANGRNTWRGWRWSPAGRAASAGRFRWRLKNAGYRVAANYAGNDQAAQQFKEETGIPVFKFDVADFNACAEGVKAIEAELGPIEVLVNNAGITRDSTMHRMSCEQWNAVIQTNLSSCFNMSRAVIDGMRSRGFGRIVNIGSINGQAGQYGQVNYAAAKSGIHGFTKALAQEGAARGITVNAVAPGYVDTDMVRAVPADVLEKIIARIPVGRLGKAEDISRTVLFLVADDADFITGSTLSVNGGQHMY